MKNNLPQNHKTVLMAVLENLQVRKQVTLFIWTPSKNDTTPRIILKNMTTDRPLYDSIANAKSLMVLFGYVLPSDTTEVFYKVIAARVRELIQNDYVQDNLLKEGYLETQIQIALSQYLEN